MELDGIFHLEELDKHSASSEQITVALLVEILKRLEKIETAIYNTEPPRCRYSE